MLFQLFTFNSQLSPINSIPHSVPLQQTASETDGRYGSVGSQVFQIQRHTKTEQMFPPKTPELPISKSITF
ncbi:hypothetical protein PRABACTJOHN_03337 [Parabacteroides johnsonii DSM 18315]|uniref:Uncharacterized protein n=1 Tax=Parabacteroides johnsonii DSM 18315 TaxID=537006 RepID=B7BE60_9BACT|nr:hypothetical protein PRABACTJOHN_03337 [Parabacteroides johnsonii DSM 18315]